MIDNQLGAGPAAVVQRIARSATEHDIDALTACFTPDYQSIWPIHPARSFGGVDQVRRNWEQIFSTVPDVRAEIFAVAVSGQDVWSEWEQSGTRVDGLPFCMRGVVVMSVHGDRVRRGRFYLEPVEPAGDEVDAAVRVLLGLTDAAATKVGS